MDSLNGQQLQNDFFPSPEHNAADISHDKFEKKNSKN